MTPPNEAEVQSSTWMTRRHLFRSGAVGLGAAALAYLVGHQGPPRPGLADTVTTDPSRTRRAKRAIYLVMNGGPSQLDLFDHKPHLASRFGENLPESVRNGQRLTTMTSGQTTFPVAPSRYRFSRYGQSGQWFSELLPWTARVGDDLCVIRTLHTDAINHDPAVTFLCTGNQVPGHASLGAWVSYGLGAINHNLPAFVVLTPSWSRGDDQALYHRLWGSAYLPTQHAGVALRARGDAVLYLSNPDGVAPETRRRMLDAAAELNRQRAADLRDPDPLERIEQYETAFRLQTAVPELLDTSREPADLSQLYGEDVLRPGSFAASCLLARRLVERDVRFVQIFHRGWDQHENVAGDLPVQCRDVDHACHGLIADLKRLGLLDETLVIWAGEFGRTVYCQGRLTAANYGRDHHPRCFSGWLAGGGVRGGISYGETDDFSYNVADRPVSVQDLNATILHCLGLDHRRLVFRSQGLDERLTGVEDHEVVREILL
jgi:Protein of unknown function (DUF1501)